MERGLSCAPWRGLIKELGVAMDSQESDTVAHSGGQVKQQAIFDNAITMVSGKKKNKKKKG